MYLPARTTLLKPSLNRIRALLSSLNRELWVTATTGIAALSVDGITLHSFAGVGLGTAHVERLVGMVRGRKGRLENWTKGEVLVGERFFFSRGGQKGRRLIGW